MKKKPLLTILIAVSLLIISDINAQQVIFLNLQESVDTALLHNQQVDRFRQVVKQKEYLNKAATGNFLPSLDLVGGYTYLSQNPEINMSQVKGSLDDMFGKYGEAVAKEIGFSPEGQALVYQSIVDGLSRLPAYNLAIDQQQYPNLNLTAVQPIFLGGKIVAGKRFAEADQSMAETELKQAVNGVVRDVLERYYGVLLLEKVVVTRKEVLAGMQKHEQQAKRAIAIGVIPPHEILRAQVAVANAERDLMDDENKLALARMALVTSLGLGPGIQVQPTASFSYKMHALNLPSLEQDAKQQQPIFQMINQQQVMAEQKHALEFSEFMPQIIAWGEYGWFRDAYPVIMPPFMVGVQARINLFHGLKKFNNLKAADYLLKEVQAARNYATGQVNLWIDQSYRNVLDTEQRYLKMQPSEELARKNLEINEKRFGEGLSTSMDVIDAQLLYEGLRVERLKSLYDYYMALADLYLATGEPQKAVDLLAE